MKKLLVAMTWIGCCACTSSILADEFPLVDTHIHYSHDAWELLPPQRAEALLREAGLMLAFVSSSSDEGTQKLYQRAPDLVVPVLRPYRKRGEISTWMHDETVPAMLQKRLESYKYAGIGEFHAFDEDVDTPVMQQVIAFAGEYGLFLHAHSDEEAIERIFATDPSAVVLWAHAGFETAESVGEMLTKYPNLWVDLAFRHEHYHDVTVNPDWLALFKSWPDRVMLGTDTYTPERWFYVSDHAADARGWLNAMDDDLKAAIGYKNALKLLEQTAFSYCSQSADDDVLIEQGDIRIRLAPLSGSISPATPFDANVYVCRNGKPLTGKIAVDADMPHHGHGMNYKPQVEVLRAGVHRVSGFVLHMPGDWRFSFELETGDQSLNFETHVDVN